MRPTRIATCVRLEFSSGHFISESLARGKCERVHGHNYVLEVCFSSDRPLPWVEDFARLKDYVRRVVEELDHRLLVPERLCDKLSHLREHVKCIPVGEVTCEELAYYIWKNISASVSARGLRVVRLRLYESSDSYVEISD